MVKIVYHFKDVFIYGKDCIITLNGVQAIVRSKEFSKVKDLKIDDSGEDLSVSREGIEHREMSKSKRFDKSRVKCFTRQKIDHFKRGYFGKRGNEDFVQIAVAFDGDNYESASVLVMSSLGIEKS